MSESPLLGRGRGEATLSSHRTDDVEVGVSDPCNIFGSQTLILINGGYISAVTEVSEQVLHPKHSSYCALCR